MRLSRRHALAGAAALVAVSPASGAPGVAGPGDMSLGNPRAPVKVVEYASLACPHCAEFHALVFPELKTRYIDTGRVHFTLKEYLTPPREAATAGFLLARCAGPSRYFQVVQDVFLSQRRWTRTNIPNVLLGVAEANGLTEAQFNACVTDPVQIAALNARVEQARKDGIVSTPTIFVNGREVHVHTFAELEAAIAAAGK